jgi:2-acylglycerol O-acyltransferase 2
MDMKKVLEGGETLSVIPGGIREMYDTQKGKIRVKIRERSGIFRLAIETKTSLVPVLTYGENELYELSRHPYLKRIQQWLSMYECILPIPSFETIQRWIQFVMGYQKTPLITVIGNPIKITNSHTIDSLREEYIQGLKDLYKETKPSSYDEEIEIL